MKANIEDMQWKIPLERCLEISRLLVALHEDCG